MRLLGVSRSSLYYRPKGESAENLALMRRMDGLHMDYPFYGSRQMMRHLRREGVIVGRHRIRRLMRLMGVEATYRRPRTSAANPRRSGSPRVGPITSIMKWFGHGSLLRGGCVNWPDARLSGGWPATRCRNITRLASGMPVPNSELPDSRLGARPPSVSYAVRLVRASAERTSKPPT